MANKSIDDLNVATIIGDNDKFLLQQDEEAKALLGSTVRSFVDRNVLTYDGEIVASDAAGGARYDSATQKLTLILPHGAGIKRVDPPANPHQPGAVDTYTLISEDVRTSAGVTQGETIGTFAVYNGMNGTGTVNTVAQIAPDPTTHDVSKTALLNALADDLFDLMWPVGSYYASDTADVNPGDTTNGVFKRGTWVQITDRVIFAAGSKTVGTHGGSETHTLTQAELPNVNIPVGDVPRSYSGGTALNYQMAMFRTDASGGSKWFLPARDDGTGGEKLVTAPLGSGTPINIMPPYEVAYVWKRTG